MPHKGLSREEVSEFEAVEAQLKGFYEEIHKLATKRANDALNKFKLDVANQLLRRANKLLAELRPLEGFGEFSEDSLPTNSDVLVVLSQYLGCMEKLRADNIVMEFEDWYWVIGGKQSDMRTGPPRKLNE